jgi:alanyl-tRNA synthetase
LKALHSDHVAVLNAIIDGKSYVAVSISESLVQSKGLDAGKIIKETIAPLIKGGGGGQKTLATAGGQQVDQLPAVLAAVKALL